MNYPTKTSASPPPYPGLLKLPEEVATDTEISDRSYHKEFSHSILRHKIEEFQAGKYSQKYIETYLDFIHLEGIIDNLKYLEYKKQLVGEKK